MHFFYDREICQNINDENFDKQEISMGKYDREDDSIPSENGLCESVYFTPDAKKLFQMW